MLNKFSPYALGLLRVVAGFLFSFHGLQKLLGWFGMQPVPVFSQLWVAAILEAIGGPLITLGLLTRPVAFILAGEMAAAYLIAHHPRNPWPVQNGGVPALLFGLIFLHLAAVGGGKFSLDSLRRGASSLERWAAKRSSATLAVLRIGAGFLFWQYGAMKFAGWFGGRRVTQVSLLWFAGILEFFGGPLIALGLFTRAVALLLSGEMAVAYWTSHVPRGGILPIQNGGEPAALFCFIFLYLATAGSGAASLYGLRSRK
jgi:putative oxidoreductase